MTLVKSCSYCIIPFPHTVFFPCNLGRNVFGLENQCSRWQLIGTVECRSVDKAPWHLLSIKLLLMERNYLLAISDGSELAFLFTLQYAAGFRLEQVRHWLCTIGNRRRLTRSVQSWLLSGDFFFFGKVSQLKLITRFSTIWDCSTNVELLT